MCVFNLFVSEYLMFWFLFCFHLTLQSPNRSHFEANFKIPWGPIAFPGRGLGSEEQQRRSGLPTPEVEVASSTP